MSEKAKTWQEANAGIEFREPKPDEMVHVTHCCSVHGCKYGDGDCPVWNQQVSQEFDCESCWMASEEYAADYEKEFHDLAEARKARELKDEAHERAEYERLKAKFEPKP